MRVLYKKPSEYYLELLDVKNESRALHELIGGYMQIIYIRPDILCICDEEGLLKELSFNFRCQFGDIVGNVIFCGMEGPEFVSLTDEQIEFTLEYFGLPMIQKS